MSYNEKLIKSAMKAGNITCMGLDPQRESLPHPYNLGTMIWYTKADFFKEIFNEMKKREVVPASFKINYGFFEIDESIPHRFGGGLYQMYDMMQNIRDKFPGTPIILDFKRADIAHASANYAKVALNWKADAVTVNPFMGWDSVMPFIERLTPEGIGVYVLNRTSNPGAKDFQDLLTLKDKDAFLARVKKSFADILNASTYVNQDTLTDLVMQSLDASASPLYYQVAEKIREWSSQHPGGVGAVVGATSMPELHDIAAMYALEGNDWERSVPLLIPGVGKQGGSAIDVMKALTEAKYDLRLARINNSRGIIHPWGRVEVKEGKSNVPEDWPVVVVDKLEEMNKQSKLPLTYYMTIDKHMTP